jgi:hypothetical protein
MRSVLILNCWRVTTTLPRVLCGCLALLAGVVFTSAAHAAKRAGVPKFDGAQEALVRKKVMQSLKAHGYDLAKSREMEIGLANTGALLDNDEGFAKVAKELALAVIITGEVGKKRAKIQAHDGKDGSLLGQASFAGANPKKVMAEVGRDFWKKLGADIQRGKAPSGAKKPSKLAVAESPDDDENTPDAAGEGGDSEPAPEPTGRKSKASEPVAAAEGGGDAGEDAPKKKKKKAKKAKLDEDVGEDEDAAGIIPPTLDISIGLSFVNRSVTYNQDVSTPGLRPYSLPAGFAPVANAVWYPLASFMDGPMAGIGIEAHVEKAFFVSSTLPTGEKFGTTIQQFSGGVRYRVPFGAGHDAYASVIGGEHAFVFTSPPGMPNARETLDIPDTIYRFVRAGIGVRLELPANLTATVAAGYRHILNGAGTHFQQVFPHSTVAGVDAMVMGGYRLAPNWEARVIIDWRRYFSAMNCNTTTMVCDVRFTAGGAVDQYLSFSGGIAYTWGGSERTVDEADDAPASPKRKRKKASDDEESAPEAGGDSGADE